MKTAIALPALLSIALLGVQAVTSTARASNIFVSDAHGGNLSRGQETKVTDMVKRAVQNMPEHNLVKSESEADFVLHPSILNRNRTQVLRIEKQKDNDLIAVAEQPLNMRTDAQSVTQTALQTDTYVTAPDVRMPGQRSPASTTGSSNTTSNDSSLSGATSSGSNSDSMTNESGMSNGMSNGSTGMDTRSIHSDAGTASSNSTTPSSSAMASDSGAAASDNGPIAGGDVRAPSPRMSNGLVPGFFQLGVGPAFAIGLNSDDIMYNINAGYNYNVSDRLTAKGFGDFNIGTGADAAQLLNFAVGADVYPENMPTFGGAKPYLMGDLGYGFARNGNTKTANDGITVGAGTGFKFAARELNWDINAHYELLTTQINGKVPSVLGLRAALNF